MRSIVLLILMVFSALAHSATVSFRDITAKDEEHLRKNLPKLMTTDVDQSVLDDAIRTLMGRGYYENVFVMRNGDGNYEIVGKPLRVVEDIQFKGVHELSESELRDLIDFKIGDRFDRKKAVAAAEKMKTYYGEHGYFNTIIEVNFQKAESKNIRLVFDIQEKPPCLIKGLDFQTQNTDLRALLNANFRNMLGRPLTTDRIRRLTVELENLMSDHRYMATEVVGPDAKYNAEKTEAYLTLEVREPYRYEFYFTGNKSFSNADVYGALDLTNRERKNVDPASEGAERLRRAYLEKGFPNVQIETKVTTPKGAPFLKRVYYTINENARVRIKGIEVQGRVTHSPRYYERFIMKNSSDLVAEGYYNKSDLENGFKNLTTELKNQGFLRARVLSSRTEYNEKHNEVMIYLLLEEGPQTQIRSIDFSGNKFFSNFELAEVTGLETNTPLRLSQFEESMDKLKNFYHRQGFLEMRLLNEGEEIIQYNDAGTQARILYQIYEGPRIRVQSIAIEGNTMTKSSVILKEADFHLGEILTPQKIDDASIRLRKLNLFTRVDIHTFEENSNKSERTLVIAVTEALPGTFNPGFGATNERGLTLRAYTGASYNNLEGTARAVSARVELRDNVSEVGFLENEASASYLEPFLFDTRTRGRVTVSRKQYVYDFREDAVPGGGPKFTELTIKNQLGFATERDLTQHTKMTWKVWNLESRTDYERYGRCLPDPTDATQRFPVEKGLCSPNVMQVATIGPQFDIDYRDNPFNPSRGSFTRWSLDYSNPNLGSSQGVEFWKSELSYTHFQPLAPGWVWANNVRGGYMANLSKERGSGVPSDYAFVLGGVYTLRAFDISSPNERVPRDNDGGWFLGTTNDKLIHTDSYFYQFKSELRFPIKGAIGGAVFYDGGSVHVSGFQFSRYWDDDAGIGFRYNTPVGAVALDLAFKLHPQGAQYDKNGNEIQTPQVPFKVVFSIGTF